MKRPETSDSDVYPRPAPTHEQKAWFDALSPAVKREAVSLAIEEGLREAFSSRSMKDIIEIGLLILSGRKRIHS